MSVTPPPVATPNGASSTIADISYRNYDGELRTRALRWWIITIATIRANVNRKKYGFWIPVVLTFLIYFFQGIMFYFSKNVQDRLAATNPMALLNAPANPYALTLYNSLNATHLLVAIAAMTVGSAVIAADNRANALLVYLSKPLTRIDYLIGKWMGVFLLLSILTVAPALLMFLFFAVSYNDEGFLKNNPTLILRLLASTLIPAAIHASLVLGFSAWSKTPRLAGALYAALYFVSGILAGTMGSVLLQKDKENKTPQTTAIVANLSVDGVSNGIAMNLYDVTPQQVVSQMQNGGRRRRARRDRGAEQNASTTRPGNKEEVPTTPPPTFQVPERPKLPIMLLFGGVLIAVPITAAYMKVRAVEVVRG